MSTEQTGRVAGHRLPPRSIADIRRELLDRLDELQDRLDEQDKAPEPIGDMPEPTRAEVEAAFEVRAWEFAYSTQRVSVRRIGPAHEYNEYTAYNPDTGLRTGVLKAPDAEAAVRKLLATGGEIRPRQG